MANYGNYKNNDEQGSNLRTNTHRAVRNDIKTPTGFVPTTSDSNGLLQTSTNIFIYANDSIVGMIQSFNITENRTINKLQAIGYEGVVQAVPSNTNGGQLNVSRIALYNSNIWNALGLTTDGKAENPVGAMVHTSGSNTTMGTDSPISGSSSAGVVFKTLRDQRVPLEVQVRTRKNGSGSGSDNFYIETYIDCWLSSYSKAYSVGTITVAEQATIQYADVY